jgi:predicted short-subunit dehydrogenase-like oxidoreductase (DUF2520 family)
MWSRNAFEANFEKIWANQYLLTTHKEDIWPRADCYIIAVKDDAIGDVAAWLSTFVQKDACVVHCSGSVGLEALTSWFSHAAVCYPYQTMALSQDRDVHFWNQLPWLLHAATPFALEKASALGALLGPVRYFVNDDQRRVYHLAAVMANNFTNFILGLSFDVLSQHQLDKNMLSALLNITYANALTHNPHDIQTGPAKRDDQATMTTHLAMLKPGSLEQQAYIYLSTLITQKHQP